MKCCRVVCWSVWMFSIHGGYIPFSVFHTVCTSWQQTKIFRIIRPTRIHVNKASFLMLNKWKNDTNKKKAEERKNERKGVGITWAVFQQRQTQIKFIVETTCFVPFEIILCCVAIDASVVLFRRCCSSSCYYYYYHCRIWCK